MNVDPKLLFHEQYRAHTVSILSHTASHILREVKEDALASQENVTRKK